MKRSALLAALIFLSASLLFSVDYGVLLDEKFEAQNDFESNNSISSTTSVTPWFSWDGGNGLSLYFSGIVSLMYTKSNDGNDDNDGLGKPAVLPELSRFAVSYRVNPNISLEAGRIFYSDILGVTASGLFDGLHFEASLGPGALNAGMYYTGLQYKDTAKILMSPSDTLNGEPRDFDKLKDYFASRRLFINTGWSMPLGETMDLSLEALVQFDLNGEDDKLHSQYGELQMEFFTQSKIGFTVGAFLELMEFEIADRKDRGAALGAMSVLRIDLPTPVNDGLKLSMKFSSGPWNDKFAVKSFSGDIGVGFAPLSCYSQGQIFPEIFSGLGVAKLNYDVRIQRSLFAETSFSYFMRTYEVPGSDDYLYGGEFWASVGWQPVDDIRLTLGGGVFFPGMGNIYPDDTDTQWKISAGISLSF